MSRRNEAPKREILPDPKYGNVRLAKFINILMLDGKKAVAERVMYGALEWVVQHTKSLLKFARFAVMRWQCVG